MESIPENLLFKVPPGALYDIRKIHNLEKPGRIEQAINILEEWILKQDHIVKKDFSKGYLEKTLIHSKGSVEKSKKVIDRLCTMKTVLPKFFSIANVKQELPQIFKYGKLFPLPILSDDFNRLIMIQANSKELTNEIFFQFYQYLIVWSEYLKAHDYSNGLIIIYDLRQSNLLDVISKLNTMELQQFLTILIDGYGGRLKSVHVLTESKAIEVIINIAKQFLSEKIGNRIYLHRHIKDLHEAVPRELLPVDYGGRQRSSDSLHEDTVQELSSEKHVEYMKMMSKACTDETKRHAGKFNEEYMGMPGSFRCLSVD